MRLKGPYEIMQVEGQSFAVPLDEEENGFDGVIRLSKTALAIFELLKEDTTEEAIVEQLGRRFDAPRDVLTADVHNTVAKFRDKGLLL